jgi:hypothetical protein
LADGWVNPRRFGYCHNTVVVTATSHLAISLSSSSSSSSCYNSRKAFENPDG